MFKPVVCLCEHYSLNLEAFYDKTWAKSLLVLLCETKLVFPAQKDSNQFLCYVSGNLLHHSSGWKDEKHTHPHPRCLKCSHHRLEGFSFFFCCCCGDSYLADILLHVQYAYLIRFLTICKHTSTGPQRKTIAPTAINQHRVANARLGVLCIVSCHSGHPRIRASRGSRGKPWDRTVVGVDNLLVDFVKWF